MHFSSICVPEAILWFKITKNSKAMSGISLVNKNVSEFFRLVCILRKLCIVKCFKKVYSNFEEFQKASLSISIFRCGFD